MKLLASLLALLLLFGCGAKNPDADRGAAQAETPPSLWTREDVPTWLSYDRMWIYSAHAETDDPALIAEIVAAIRALKVGERNDAAAEDYTDVLVFTFADGETLRLEFEDQTVVTDSGTRYAVDGLDALRTILDTLVEETNG